MATKPAIKKMEQNREALLMAYIESKAVLDEAESRCKAAQQALKDDLGPVTETMCGPFKITYRPDKEIDQARLKTERPDAFKKCQIKFDVGVFRSFYPELVETFEKDSNKRPLKISAV